MNKPIAVLISDIHYSLPTLELADAAMRMAIAKANDLKVPLIVAGDLHDTKANLRGECVNAMIKTFKLAFDMPTVLVGNHDRINEKSEDHSLNFLDDLVHLVDKPSKLWVKDIYFIPYQHDTDTLRTYLQTIPKRSTLIMHQGLVNSNAGHYMQDKSAITKKDVAGFRVISGHYHARQTIALPNGGKWDYIGNPYTLNYGEANDPPKGFQVLYDDGSLEFVPTNLRKHVVIEAYCGEYLVKHNPQTVINPNDLVWVKVEGSREDLKDLTKVAVQNTYHLPETFKLDLIPLESETLKPTQVNRTQPEILDELIDSLTNTSDEQKERVKALWKVV